MVGSKIVEEEINQGGMASPWRQASVIWRDGFKQELSCSQSITIYSVFYPCIFWVTFAFEYISFNYNLKNSKVYAFLWKSCGRYGYCTQKTHIYTEASKNFTGVHVMSIQRPFEWSMEHVKIPHFIKCKGKKFTVSSINDN